MCQKCGCNTCETIRGPLLTEGKVKKLISENLSYHIDNNISLMENVFRIGSDAHLSMIKEARKLYSRGVLDLCEEDEGLMETHIGEFDLYENEIVPLDLPMIDLSENEDVQKRIKAQNIIKKVLKDEGGAAGLKPIVAALKDLKISKDELIKLLKKTVGVVKHQHGDYIIKPIQEVETKEEELLRDIRDILKAMLLGDEEREEDIEDLDISIDDLNTTITGKDPVDLQYTQKYLGRLAEAKKKKKKEKKDPPIGKPKRGGSKAYYVYVRDPKTKRIKKVSFGSGGLRAKIRNPKARKAFAARHKCSQKNDRTKASYWSCRLPRYASQLGLGANMNTFW